MNQEEKIKFEIKKLESEKEQLETNEEVIRYINVNKMIELKKDELVVAHENKMMKKYDRCNHYFVSYKVDANTTRKISCILCGLSDVTFNKKVKDEEVIMKRYIGLRNFRSVTGNKEIKYRCDIDLAQAMINKIKEANKGIKRDQLIKYFEIALDNMIDIEVNNERIHDRAKRLGVKVADIKSIRKN